MFVGSLIQKMAPVVNKGNTSVCWLLIQKLGPVINKGPRVSYSWVTCLGLKLVKNQTQTLLLIGYIFHLLISVCHLEKCRLSTMVSI